MQPIGDTTMAGPEPRLIPVRRRGRPRTGQFPQTRRQMLDAAKREALEVAFGRSGADLMHRDCGSLQSGERWFCVQTHAGQERRAALDIRDLGLRVFLPAAIRGFGSEMRRRLVVRPELPRYLFVAFDPSSAPWRKVCYCAGVARLFTFGDWTPAPARPGDVERLIDLVRERIGAPDPADRPAQAGDVGEIVAGPLAGFRCVAVETLGDGSVRVQFTLFGRSSPVVLERGAVRWGGQG